MLDRPMDKSPDKANPLKLEEPLKVPLKEPDKGAL